MESAPSYSLCLTTEGVTDSYLPDRSNPLAIFELLASPYRQKIINELRLRPLYVSEIQKILNTRQSVASYHLAALRKAGIIQVRPEPFRKESKKNFYSLCPEELGRQIVQGLQALAPEAIVQARKRRHSA